MNQPRSKLRGIRRSEYKHRLNKYSHSYGNRAKAPAPNRPEGLFLHAYGAVKQKIKIALSAVTSKAQAGVLTLWDWLKG